MAERLPEAVRDQVESAFTPILRRLWLEFDQVLAVAFVDTEGECIDYVCSIEPYDAKVVAAHARVLADNLEHRHPNLPGGRAVTLEVLAETRELWARRISDEYLLVALTEPGIERTTLHLSLVRAGREFRHEVGMAAPEWEPAEGVEVSVREAVGWKYAPQSMRENGVQMMITEVIGRWQEPRQGVSGDDLVCFRVRTEAGQEFTLVHDPDRDGWQSRP
jgi:predicted regulator of Ras-like GTPase activity (Roadblock/LC7/MglB family)